MPTIKAGVSVSNSKLNLALSILLFAAAAVFGVGFVAALVASFLNSPPTFLTLLAAPTQLVFDAFSLASIFLPLFLLLQGLQLRKSPINLRRVLAISLFTFPAIFAGFALRFALLAPGVSAEAGALAAIESALTRPGAIAIFGLLAVFVSLLTLQIPGLFGPKREREAGAEAGLANDELPAVVPVVAPLANEPSSEDLRRDSWFVGDTTGSATGSTAADSTQVDGSATFGEVELVEGEFDEVHVDQQPKDEAQTLAAEMQAAGYRDDGYVEIDMNDQVEDDGVETLEEIEGNLSEYDSPGSHEALPPKIEIVAPTAAAVAGAAEAEAAMNQPGPGTEEVGDAEEELSIFFSRGRIRELTADAANDNDDDLDDDEDIEVDLDSEDGAGDYGPDYASDDSIIEDQIDEAMLPPPAPKLPARPYKVPIDGVLNEIENTQYWEIDAAARNAGEVLRTTLEEFGIQAEVTGIRKGPVITMFEILPAPGVKLARIVNLADNIALRLAASSVRIVAPIPGKHAVGIEIPNKVRHLVGFAELLSDPSFEKPEHEIPVALGKDITGDSQIIDIAKTPHLLIAGATGSGKSVCVNSLICSVLYRRSPAEVKMILIDPKIVELKFYNDIPHLLTPVITDPKKAFQALQWCIYEMERRYSLLDAMAVRDIKSFNKKIKAKAIATAPLPYIVVVVDEFADLMATTGKELESTLARLAAMSRAVGIHLVLATQRPSTDVITGLIKANIPTRIAFMVASKVDSRIILDTMGADKLLGRGDMLYTSATDPFPIRIQGAYLSEEEVERVVNEVKKFGKPDYIDDEIFIDEDEDDTYYQQELEDPLLEKAIEIVQSAGKASASYLQRRLKIGYNRAARLVEHLEQMGVVGPQNGSKAREILRAFQ